MYSPIVRSFSPSGFNAANWDCQLKRYILKVIPVIKGYTNDLNPQIEPSVPIGPWHLAWKTRYLWVHMCVRRRIGRWEPAAIEILMMMWY